MDYKAIGFKAGLEIHQQIASHKLFCNCPSKIEDSVDFTFERSLRPTQSELGDIDKAALAEAKKKLYFCYRASNSSTCGVEADEEPPHQANKEALRIALTIALRLNSTPLDEIQWMRKLVIDGSNTAGFQRTGLVGLGGEVDRVGIETIALEEDAARKIEQKGKVVYYNLDRLGIPLIEISTKPTIESPAEVKRIAERIGSILRSTKKVKRGIGTIRQDLNLSIREGTRVEIKGVQNLRALQKVAEQEVQRQLQLIRTKKGLERRKVTRRLIGNQRIVDLTDLFKQSNSKKIKSAIDLGGKILALKLPVFTGLIKPKLANIYSLGKEFASYTEIETGIKSIFNSDELPNHEIDESLLAKIRKRVSAKAKDAFVLAVGERGKVIETLKGIRQRAIKALGGVPEEVRRALPDCSTKYMRPLPGAARMYPETDIPPARISARQINSLKAKLPPLPEERIEAFLRSHKLSKEQAKQIIDQELEDLFEELVKTYPKQERLIARVLLNTLPEISVQGIEIASDKPIKEVLKAIEANRFAKEAVPQVLTYLFLHPDQSLEQAIKACKLEALDMERVKQLITKIIKERKEFIEAEGMRAFSLLMGVVMKELRGKVDGGVIAELVKVELNKAIEQMQ
jgi:glutamyl-tRNA(Gln) amidotransferase subunit E